MKRIIALAGNPNSGKTSLFNELTGANQYVGNWPGVTVEKVTGQLKDAPEVTLQDLPGIYSLSPYTPEEVVARRYLLEEKPELLVNVVDATNLERNLYLTTQLIETGLPMVIALNMIDLAESKGRNIDAEALSREFGCPVLKVSALQQIGLAELEKVLTDETLPAPARPISYPPAVEEAVAGIRAALPCTRLEAVKMLEDDSEFISHLKPDVRKLVETARAAVEKESGDDISSVIASGRYDAISALTPKVAERSAESTQPGISARADAVLTHRVAGPLIFVGVMWFVYYIAIGTIGTWGTDWANDVLFGEYVPAWMDGLMGDTPADFGSMLKISTVLAMIFVFPVTLRRLHDLGKSGSLLYLVIAPFLLEYMFPHLPGLLHTGLLYILYAINLAILLLCFFKPGDKGGNPFGGKPGKVGLLPLSLNGRAGRLEYALHAVLMSALGFGIAYLGGHACLNCSPQVCSLVNDGIIAGVGAVLGFLPQMAVLFLLLSLLEDCGYMARVAFMMDRIFRSIGLSGKSFIPLMVAMGCGVPAIMATRTIENEKDRRMSIMLTTFVPCGAKLPVIALFAALLGQDALVATGAYFAGIASVILGGTMLRKTALFAGSYTPFVMELPAYHMPRGANINLRAMERCKAFVHKAGTIIFLSSALIWFLSNYSTRLDYLGEQEDAMEQSMLADAGMLAAPVFSPLGWGHWKPTVAAVTGLVAKEQIISTIGVLYPAQAEEAAAEEENHGESEPCAILPRFNAFSALSTAAWALLDPQQIRLNEPEADEGEEEEDETDGIAERLQAAGTFGSTGAALSFLLFNLLCAPCFAACATIRREMNSARWTALALGFMCTWAYVVSLLIYKFEHLALGGEWGVGSAIAVVLAVLILFQIFRPTPKRN